MSVPVAILAGGLATRLRPITEAVPKSLIEVAGKPFILHQIDLLRRNQVDRIVLCVGHLGEQIQSALGDGSRYGVQIDYSYDGTELLGTGGALHQALPRLGPAFFLLYGDSYLDCDYQAAWAAFEESERLGLMTVYRNEGRWERSNVLFTAGLIARYDKRQPLPEMQHIDYGLGLLKRDALVGKAAGQTWDLADLYADLAGRGQLAGYEVTRRYFEVGSPAGLCETCAYLSAPRARPTGARGK